MYNDDDTIILKKWCIEWEVPYPFAERLKGTVFPLLEGAHNRIGFNFDRIFLEQKEGVELRHENSERIMLLLRNKIVPQNFSAEEREVIGLHLEYMTTVEGFLAPEVNFLIFLIIANGHNFKIAQDKYAKTMRDIEKSNFSKKMEFLGKHGFRELSKNKDRILSLRNSAAHLFYKIDKKGGLNVGKNKITRENYDKLYDYLRNTAVSLHLIRLLYYRRFESLPTPKYKMTPCKCGYENLVPIGKRPKNGAPWRCSNCNLILK